MTLKDWVTGALIFGAFALGVYITSNAYEEKIAEYKVEAEKQYSELLQQKIESDNRNAARVAQAEIEGLKALEDQKESYEKTISDLRANFRPSGVRKCSEPSNSMPRTDQNSTELVCYSKDELRGKIEQSLAIAREADELAVKYNSLLKLHEGK